MLTASQADAILQFRSSIGPSGSFSILGFNGTQLAALNDLVACHYAEVCSNEHYRLTPDAYRALADYEYQQRLSSEQAQRRAEEEHQHAMEQQLQNKRYRKDTRRSWLQLIVTLFIGWILGLATPIDVWHWLSSLF